MATDTWAHIAVPNYSLASPTAYASGLTYASAATASLSTTGSSFLRIGSFPDVDNPSSTSNPTGFSNSLALVQLIGRLEYIDDTVYDKKDSTSTGEYGVLHADPRAGDTTNSLIGFLDDTRSRPDSLDFGGTLSEQKERQFVNNSSSDEEDNTTTNRQDETRRLLYKGGWWDHTDGNRIVTTGGDKIEIIQGNYKLAVLCRQNPSDSTYGTSMLSVTDVSGGLDNGVTYEWLPNEDMWAVYDKSSAKYAYKETQGVDVSVFTGTKKVTLVGSESAGTNPETISKSYASRTESYTGSVIDWVKQSYSLSYTTERVELAVVGQTSSFKFIGTNFSVAASRIAFIEAKLYTHSLAVAYAPATYSLIGAIGTYDIKVGNEWSYSTVEKIEIFGTVKLEPVEIVIGGVNKAITKAKARVAKLKLKLSGTHVEAAGTKVEAGVESNELNAITVRTG